MAALSARSIGFCLLDLYLALPCSVWQRMMGSCLKVELVLQVLFWKGGQQAAAAPSQNLEGVWLAVGIILAVACLPLPASGGFLDFRRWKMAA